MLVCEGVCLLAIPPFDMLDTRVILQLLYDSPQVATQLAVNVDAGRSQIVQHFMYDLPREYAAFTAGAITAVSIGKHHLGAYIRHPPLCEARTIAIKNWIGKAVSRGPVFCYA